MADEVRVWQVGQGDILMPITRVSLDKEKRVEEWVKRDITVLDPELLVIGQQVRTAFDKLIDLLCINADGDLVIVELKRDETPRNIVAQALDYGSWVRDLDPTAIKEIAATYFKKTNAPYSNLEEAFSAYFQDKLPDVLNESHGIRVVASEMDDSTERIIRYLSEDYGVDINAVRFAFFKTLDNHELLVRTVTVATEEAESNIRKRPGKRLPPLTLKEMEQFADSHGVGSLYRACEKALAPLLRPVPTRTTLSFDAPFPDGSRKVLLNIVPGESSPEQGLRYRIYSTRMAQLLGADEEVIKQHLPANAEHWQYAPSAPIEYHGLAGYIRTEDEIRKMAELVRRAFKAEVAGAANAAKH
jgi:hypothetical protein